MFKVNQDAGRGMYCLQTTATFLQQYTDTLKSLEFSIETAIYSDDLPKPSIKKLIVNGESENKTVNLEEIKELEMDRFRNSHEYEEFKKWHSEHLE